MITKRQKQALDFITDYQERKGYAPSLDEIRGKLKLSSVSTAHFHVSKLRDLGYLTKEKNQPRGIEISKSEKLVSIPLLGTIAAGQPIEAVLNPESIAIPKSKLPADTKNIYALRVAGDSMVDENINDGDTVLIKQQNTAENGQKVVALINNNEATLKKFYKEHGRVRLQPANKSIGPILINAGMDLAIQGIVVGVLENNPFTPGLILPAKKEEIKKYNKLPLNQIICGDAVEKLKELPDKSIDLILTDPPYGLNTKGIKNDNNLNLFYSILPESHRVLKDDSFFITFFSTKFLPKIFKNNPFQYFWNFVLYCPNGRVISPIGFTKYMSCVVFRKGNPKMIKKGKDIFVDTPGKMVEPDEGFINHPTPKPKTFIKEILNLFSKENDIILDPFVGSGSTAVACKILKRNYIGFEINPNYCKLSEHRINKF